MTRYLVTRANALVLGVLIAIIVLVSGLTWDRITAARAARAWSQHSYEVLATIKDLNLAVHDAAAFGAIAAQAKTKLEQSQDTGNTTRAAA